MLTSTRLLGDGKHGRAERIQTFRGLACHTTFTARRHTPLYRLKTPSHQIALVLSARACGLDPSAAERVFGYRQATIITWLTRAGKHAENFHERCFRNLHLPHLQLDEIRTRLRRSTQVRLSVAGLLSPQSFPSSSSVHVHRTWPICSSTPCDSFWPPFCLPLFTSDGLYLSFSALTAHFGQWHTWGRRGVRRWQGEPGLIYGQVKKNERRRKLVRVMHVMRLGTEDALQATLQGLGFSGRLNTACIERAPLTVRHGIAALALRTWARAQPSPHLLALLEWWRAYSHFVRPHQSLRVVLVQPRERGAS